MKELTVEAKTTNIEAVTNFVNEQLEALDCPMKAQMQIDIAIDELFGNIAPPQRKLFIFRTTKKKQDIFQVYSQDSRVEARETSRMLCRCRGHTGEWKMDIFQGY